MIGRVVGNYRIEALIGEGGMARVFRARHTSLDRVVAIKALRPDLAADPAVRERIVAEQRVLDRLRHPAIVGLYDVHVEGADLFLVMELVEGETLRERVARDGPLALEAACTVACEILAGLAHAHEAGVVHRDVKPANVMLTAETAKLVDFGVARAADAAAVTVAGMVVGSPAYLPPERWEAAPATPATDVYGVGLCLWEALTGYPPVSPDAGWKACYKAHTVHGIPDVRTARAEVPAWLAEVVARATRKEPEARFVDAGVMLAAIQTGMAGQGRGYEEQRTVLFRARSQAGEEEPPRERAVRESWQPGRAPVAALA
ncbi:MAG: serine/threonine-protein kinase, partial [Pseudomonadota bacterium]